MKDSARAFWWFIATLLVTTAYAAWAGDSMLGILAQCAAAVVIVTWLLIPERLASSRTVVTYLSGATMAICLFVYWYFRPVPDPRLSINLEMIGRPYTHGSTVWGVQWEPDYRPYRITIANENPEPLLNVDLVWALPFAVINIDDPMATGTTGLTIGQDRLDPITWGSGSGPGFPLPLVHNFLKVYAARLESKGRVSFVVVATIRGVREGGWARITHSYEHPEARSAPTTEVRPVSVTNQQSGRTVIAEAPLEKLCRRSYVVLATKDRVFVADDNYGELELHPRIGCGVADCPAEITDCNQIDGPFFDGERLPDVPKGHHLELRLKPLFGPQCDAERNKQTALNIPPDMCPLPPTPAPTM